MENSIYSATELGTPQGRNPLPLLSNVLLNELDKELVKLGLNWFLYVDDCVPALRSSASAKRVMHTITRWIEQKLGSKVNAEKTHVYRLSKLKYLGFGFYKIPQTQKWATRPHESSVVKFQRTLRKLCKRSWSISMVVCITKLNITIRGCINYFPIANMKGKNGKDRRTPADNATQSDVGTMEDTSETSMGTTKT